MAKKDKVNKEQVVEAPKTEENPIQVYKVGDLKIRCHACGNVETLEKGIKGGIRFDLYTTNKHKLVLSCSKCENKMEMFFEEGFESPIVDMDGNSTSTQPSADKIVDKVIEESTEEIPQSGYCEEDLEISEEMPEDIINEINGGIEDENPVQEENKQEELA